MPLLAQCNGRTGLTALASETPILAVGTDYVTVLGGAPEITCLSLHTDAISWRYQNSQIFDNVLTQMGDYSLLSLLQSETQSAFWRAIGGECDVWSKSSSHWGAAKE